MSFTSLRDAIEASVAASVEGLAALLPQLAGALVAIALGWAVARLVEGAVRRLLQRLGLDRLADRGRLTEALRSAGVRRTASGLVPNCPSRSYRTRPPLPRGCASRNAACSRRERSVRGMPYIR